MQRADKRKQSLYFPEDMLKELRHEAERLDRSLSWIVQRCVRIGMKEIQEQPSTSDIPLTPLDEEEE
jgi:uncharacterized small protein (TIGR04563 family)